MRLLVPLAVVVPMSAPFTSAQPLIPVPPSRPPSTAPAAPSAPAPARSPVLSPDPALATTPVSSTAAAAPIQAPRLLRTDGGVVEPAAASVCLSVRSPNDAQGTLASEAEATLRLALGGHGYWVVPEDATCAFRVRLTLLRNLNAQGRTLSVGVVATVGRVFSADGLAEPLNALAQESVLTPSARATVQRLRRSADTYERFVGSDVSSASGSLVAPLTRLAERLRTNMLIVLD